MENDKYAILKVRALLIIVQLMECTLLSCSYHSIKYSLLLQPGRVATLIKTDAQVRSEKHCIISPLHMYSF